MTLELLNALNPQTMPRPGPLLLLRLVADTAGEPTHGLDHPVLIQIIKEGLSVFMVPEPSRYSAFLRRRRERREVVDRPRIITQRLGDEDEGRLGFADAAARIAEDETETDDACGADFSVATRSVGNPFEIVGADGTAIIHCSLFEFGIED